MTLGTIGIGDAPCVPGTLDAQGNTIVSCGYTPGMDLTTGQMIANAPTCMAGDTLSFVSGSWVCVPASTVGIPSWALLGVVALALVMIAGRR